MDYFEKPELQKRPSSAPPAEIPDEFEIRPLFSGARSEGASLRSSCTTPLSWLEKLDSGSGSAEADADLDQHLAEMTNELTIANIESHMANSMLDANQDITSTSYGFVDKMIAELDAEIKTYSSASESNSSTEIDPQQAVAVATTRILKFRTSYEYLAYLHDLNFKERYSQQPCVRTEGRLAAFRDSSAYQQHQEDVSFILKHGDSKRVAAVCDFD